MMVQPRQYWIADYSYLFYGVYPYGKQPIFLLSFSRWRGAAVGKMLFASWYCGSQTFQKTSVFFGKLFYSTLKQKALPARRAGAKQGGLYVLNDLFYVIRLIWLLIDLKNNRFSLLGSCLWKAEDCRSECAFIESDETLFFVRSATSYRLSLQ